tara:strand:- start:1581 stop:2048 length:468 start_codon:yes stop_codon:yes gene_type:complete
MTKKTGMGTIDPIKEIKNGIKNVSKFEKFLHPVHAFKRTFGQKAADSLTKFAGSWTFISLFGLFLVFWMFTNTIWLLFGDKWDIYPFILLNLVLSCLAAIQAPIILMSQNRENQRDRNRAEYDYRINKKAEAEIQDMQKDLEIIKKLLKGGKKRK